MVKTLLRSRSDPKYSFGSSLCGSNPRGHPLNLALFVPIEVLFGQGLTECSEEVSGPKPKRVRDVRSASLSPTSFGRWGLCSHPWAREQVERLKTRRNERKRVMNSVADLALWLLLEDVVVNMKVEVIIFYDNVSKSVLKRLT